MERDREIIDKLIKSINDKFQEKSYKGYWYGLETNELCELLANVNWMCFLYKIEGLEGCYCSDCVKKITEERQEEGE